tara:strand:+ start:379 stop:669 length:291 start_codon:yes stop_codon:yes gene_type:complete
MKSSLMDKIEDMLECARDIAHYSKEIDSFSKVLQEQLWQAQLSIMNFKACGCEGYGLHRCGLEDVLMKIDNVKVLTRFSEFDRIETEENKDGEPST